MSIFTCPNCHAEGLPADETPCWKCGSGKVSARDAKTRAQILADARRLRTDIEQTFLDAGHWNRIHPDEEPIDPDPDGQLRRIANGIDHMLTHDRGGGPLAEIVERDKGSTT